MKNSARYISKVRLSSYFLLVLLIFLQVFIQNASAVVSSCTASVSPSSVTPGTTGEFTYSLNNTSAQTVNWIKITRPSSNFTFSGYSSIGSFTIETSTDNITLTGSSLDAGASASYTLEITSGDSEVSSADWTIQVSDDGGSSTTPCSGSLGTAISGSAPDTEVPQISELTISEIIPTSVKITWTTNEAATSVVDYGTTDGYGSTKSDSSLVTSHSLTLDGLSANTTYHFNTKSTDSAGNTEEWGDETFTTAKAGLTSEIKTITTTTIRTVTPTPTPTPIPDTTKPTIKINTDFSAPFETAPNLTGSAYDASGINKIEYSIDNGKNWIPISFDNIGNINIRFDIKPESLEDDNYNVKFRAYDTKLNVAYSKTFVLVIDRMAPQVGGSLISIGPQVLSPDKNGSILAVAGLDQKIVLSAIGGATSIDLFADKQMFSMTKNPDNGLWYGTLSFQEKGTYVLKAKALDGAGNETERVLGRVVVIEPGRVFQDKPKGYIKDAELTIYSQNIESKIWTVWDASAYGQKNPQKTDKDGFYRFVIPSGTYYLTIKKNGFSKITSDIFNIDKPTPLNSNFFMMNTNSFLGITLPDLLTKPVRIEITDSSHEVSAKSSLLNKEASLFSLPATDGNVFDLSSLRGGKSVLAFVSTWSPSSLEQILVLARLAENKSMQFAVVDLQESLPKISIFQKKGNYKFTFVADTDGTLVEDYNISSLPALYFLDRKGIIRGTTTEVLNEEEIQKMLDAY